MGKAQATRTMRLMGKNLAKERPAIAFNDARKMALTQARAYAVKEHLDGNRVDVPSLAADFLNGLEDERGAMIGDGDESTS